MSIKLLENPIKWYVNTVKSSIEPTTLDHRIRMGINIKKGKTTGRALIPCAIYSYDHSIDLNPALIRRKDNKKVKDIPVNKAFSYDSKRYNLQLTKQEKEQGYTLNEIKKCNHCNQRLVIAEVAETRYRSCPDIKVRVADKAKEDIYIPVDFGINKSDVFTGMFAWVVFDMFLAVAAIQYFTKTDFINFGINKIDAVVNIPNYMILPIIVILSLFFGLFLLVFLGRVHYKAYKLWKWWNEVKHTVTKVRVAG